MKQMKLTKLVGFAYLKNYIDMKKKKVSAETKKMVVEVYKKFVLKKFKEIEDKMLWGKTGGNGK